MSAGSVSIADDGTVTKSGLAEAIYDARVAMLALTNPVGVIAAGAAGVPVKKGLAFGANADSSAIWTYLGANFEPAGVIKAWGAAAAPTGYLLCNGSAVSRTTYAALFAAIGTTYGIGDGATTFNVPDGRGRALIGSGTGDASDATAHALAQKTGTETHTLTSAQMPVHSHGVTDPEHDHNAGAGATGFVVEAAGGDLDIGAGSAYEVRSVTGEESTDITIDNAGASAAHNNMQPSLAINWIIKV